MPPLLKKVCYISQLPIYQIGHRQVKWDETEKRPTFYLSHVSCSTWKPIGWIHLVPGARHQGYRRSATSGSAGGHLRICVGARRSGVTAIRGRSGYPQYHVDDLDQTCLVAGARYLNYQVRCVLVT